jgi:hypothetical protein
MRLPRLIGLKSPCARALRLIYPRARGGVVVLAAWLLAGCAPAAQPPQVATTAAPEPELCPVGPQAEARISASTYNRPIVFLLPGPVDVSNAIGPSTSPEGILFAQLYETLVRVNCQGRVEGELAESWSVSEDSLEWTFRLRADARDWSGAPVTSNVVGQSWAMTDRAAADAAVATLRGPRITEIRALDARTLRARTSERVNDSWFARPELAVARPSDLPSGWPLGSGPVRPADLSFSSVSAGPLPVIPLMGAVAIEARAFTSDPRDALEMGGDLLVTSDPRVIGYAQSSPAFIPTPLVWNQSWVLLTPAGVPDPGTGSWNVSVAPSPSPIAPWSVRVMRAHETVRGSWARDAVPLEARPPALDAQAMSGCGRSPQIALESPASGRNVSLPATRDRRIVYTAGDAVARALAERLIALALDAERLTAAARQPGFELADWFTRMVPDLAGPGPRPTAVGLPPADFASALRGGRDAGYVVPVERSQAVSPCESFAGLTSLAPWLAVESSEERPTSPAPAALLLVDTRNTLVLRRGIVGVTVDGSGVIQLGGVRRTERE